MDDWMKQHIIVGSISPAPTFYRHCETCGKGINEGYLIADGAYCSLACADWTQAEWDEYNELNDNDGDNYYTEWEEE